MAFTLPGKFIDRVTDPAGNALPGATVTVPAGYTATVDAVGNLTIVGPPSDNVTYSVAIGGVTVGTFTVPVSPAVAEIDADQIADTAAIAAKLDKALVDAKGDLLVGSANDTVVRRAVGTNGTVLTADSAETDGVKWAPVTPSPAGSIDDPIHQSLLGEFFPYPFLIIAPGNIRPSSGRIDLVKVPLPVSGTITNVLLSQNQAGAGLTAGQNLVAVYDSTGARIGVSADQSATWAAGTAEPRTIPLVTPVAVTGGRGAYVYVAVLSVGTTTVGLRALAAPGGTFFNLPNPPAKYWVASNLTGQTSLPASLDLTANVPGNNSYWAGVS